MTDYYFHDFDLLQKLQTTPSLPSCLLTAASSTEHLTASYQVVVKVSYDIKFWSSKSINQVPMWRIQKIFGFGFLFGLFLFWDFFFFDLVGFFGSVLRVCLGFLLGWFGLVWFKFYFYFLEKRRLREYFIATVQNIKQTCKIERHFLPKPSFYQDQEKGQQF